MWFFLPRAYILGMHKWKVLFDGTGRTCVQFKRLGKTRVRNIVSSAGPAHTTTSQHLSSPCSPSTLLQSVAALQAVWGDSQVGTHHTHCPTNIPFCLSLLSMSPQLYVAETSLAKSAAVEVCNKILFLVWHFRQTVCTHRGTGEIEKNGRAWGHKVHSSSCTRSKKGKAPRKLNFFTGHILHVRDLVRSNFSSCVCM